MLFKSEYYVEFDFNQQPTSSDKTSHNNNNNTNEPSASSSCHSTHSPVIAPILKRICAFFRHSRFCLYDGLGYQNMSALLKTTNGTLTTIRLQQPPSHHTLQKGVARKEEHNCVVWSTTQHQRINRADHHHAVNLSSTKLHFASPHILCTFCCPNPVRSDSAGDGCWRCWWFSSKYADRAISSRFRGASLPDWSSCRAKFKSA